MPACLLCYTKKEAFGMDLFQRTVQYSTIYIGSVHPPLVARPRNAMSMQRTIYHHIIPTKGQKRDTTRDTDERTVIEKTKPLARLPPIQQYNVRWSKNQSYRANETKSNQTKRYILNRTVRNHNIPHPAHAYRTIRHAAARWFFCIHIYSIHRRKGNQ